MALRFWGVRGSTPCPGPRYVRYGGNTSCLELRCGERLLVLDAGTGLRELGLTLSGAQDADLLLTHTHLDHIGGIPFFGPLYDPRSRFVLWAGHLLPERTLEQVLHEFMADPVFPVPPSVFPSRVEYRDFRAGEVLEPRPGIVVRTAPLHHPNRATGYRIEHEGHSICYVTDTEHRPGERDSSVVALVRDADLLVYDCSYTDASYAAHQGWGHSTWEEGVRIADEANVGRLIVFHHDPAHDDDTMDHIAEEADRARRGTIVAREGMLVDV